MMFYNIFLFKEMIMHTMMIPSQFQQKTKLGSWDVMMKTYLENKSFIRIIAIFMSMIPLDT